MAQSTNNQKTKKSNRLKRVLFIANIVALVGLSFSTAFFAYKYYDLKANTSKTQEERNQELVAEVAKVYSLPGDETPVVALVADEAKFKEEYKVFTDVRKDDYLLLYQKGGLAVLYRPSEKKVIATAPLAVTQEYAIALIGADAATTDLEKKLEEQVPTETRVLVKQAGVTPYSSTVVIDVNGDKKDVATQLATLAGGTVGTLPDGEKAPEGADFVIIVGSPVQEAVPTQ